MNTPSSAGFTLMELLLAVALGSVVLVAMASSAGLYGNQVAQATEGLDVSLEAALEEISQAVQLAWTVERPTSSKLVVTDAVGRVTTYERDGDTLKVTRPNGASGVLVDDVANVRFAAETIRRLREAAPVESYGPWFDSAPTGAAIPMELRVLGDPRIDKHDSPFFDPTHMPGLLQRNDAVSLSFTIPAAAPMDLNTLPDVQEQFQGTTIERILLPISHISELPPIPANVKSAETGNKVTVCHYPPGNPRNAHIINIGSQALDVHLAHGDTAGNCPIEITDPDPGELIVAIFETGGADDAVPTTGAHALAFIKLPASSLPLAGWRFTGITESPVVSYNDPKLVIDTPTKAVPLDIASLRARIEPGTPYTMVLAYTGSGFVALDPTTKVSPINSGVAARREGETEFTPQTWDVNFKLDGTRSYSQTSEIEVISRVNTAIALNNGRSVTGTALVTSQALASDPWYGQVPGELPTLQSLGH